MKAPLFDITGKHLKDVTLPSELFDREVSPVLIAQVIRVLKDNQHQSTSKVKTRGEVNRTTKKVYAQKHTGNARHGSRKAPIYVGGGVAHGPKGVQPGDLKVTRKVRHLSVLGGLNLHAKNQTVSLIEDLKDAPKKTKELRTILDTISEKKNTLILTSQRVESLIVSSGNLKTYRLMPSTAVNIYQLLRAKHLIIDQSALDQLKTILLKGLKTK
jgi:large subunit ribosomal protein L4